MAFAGSNIVVFISTLFSIVLFKNVRCNAPSDIKLDEKARSLHRVDCLNILAYVFLMIITVCTIWLFKHRRARFLHETGLAIIYGLIVGVIIRYAGEDSEVIHMKVIPAEGYNATVNLLPDNLYLPLHLKQSPSNDKVLNKTYAYVFRGEYSDVDGKKLDQKATFDPEIFFNIILPPIIFNAGYSLKRKHFFRNLGTIMTFAFIGTTISCFVVGLILWAFLQLMPYIHFTFNECLFFGAIVSATDPVTVLAIFNDLHVDVNLYAMVFGESILNDAVAIVLAGAINTYAENANTGEGDQWKAAFSAVGNFLYIFVCSLLIGSVTGCLTAILTKFTRLCDFPLLESCLFVLMSYSTFLIAEAADLTGIVAVLFCGICQAHYTYNNLSLESRSRTKQVFELLNFLSENFIFTYIGVSMFTYQKHHWDAAFIIISFLAIAIGRAMNIYPLSFLLNLGRHHKIPFNFQHMLFFSGLRGAMAFALAIRNTFSEPRHLMLTTTSLIVMVTVMVCGGLTTQLLAWLGIPVGVEEEHEMLQFGGMRMVYNSTDEGVIPQVTTPTELRSPPASENKTPYEKAWLVRKWYSFDVKYMKPFLTHSRPTLMDTLPACCLPIARVLTSTQQLSQTDDNRHHDDDSDTDLCIDESELNNARPNTVSRHHSRSNQGAAVGPALTSDSAIEGDLGLTSGLMQMSQTRVTIPGLRGDFL